MIAVDADSSSSGRIKARRLCRVIGSHVDGLAMAGDKQASKPVLVGF